MKTPGIMLLGFALVTLIAFSACSQIVTPAEVAPGYLESQATMSGESPLTVRVGFDVNTSDMLARPIDSETLADLPGYEPLALGHHYNEALSPGGDLWAVVKWPDDGFFGGTLLLVDLMGWENVPTELEFFGYVSLMTFSPDESRLVVSQVDWEANATTADLHVIDVSVPDQGRVVPLDFVPNETQFDPGGGRVFLYGQTTDPATGEARPPGVAAVDLTSGETLWSLQLDGVKDGWFSKDVDPDVVPAPNADVLGGVFYQPGVAFDANGEWLYVVHPDADRITRVNLATGTSEALPIAEKRALLDGLLRLAARPAFAKGPMDTLLKSAALSPDGSRLYVTGLQTAVTGIDEGGAFEVTQNPLDLQVIDTRSGEVLAGIETDLTGLALSPDGERLYLTYQPDPYQSDPADSLARLAIRDADSLELEGQFSYKADDIRVGFTGGGQPYVIATTWYNQPPEIRIYQLSALTGETVAVRTFGEAGGTLVLMTGRVGS